MIPRRTNWLLPALCLAVVLVSPRVFAADEDAAIRNVQTARLMTGYPDGSFHPEGRLTRAQLAVIINRAFELSKRRVTPQVEAATPDAPPADVPATHWAYNDIQTVLKYNVMEGYREGRFHPEQPVTRAEALAIFAQAYGVYQYNDATVHDILAEYPDADEIPDWAKKAMATALKHGFVNVASGEPLRPLQPMTRGDMAFALNEYLSRIQGVDSPDRPR